MFLRILDTQLHAKGMKNIGKLRHALVPSLLQRGPLYAFILIAWSEWKMESTHGIHPPMEFTHGIVTEKYYK